MSHESRATSHESRHWSGKRVLVTGAGGFIGSHLTERLVELGATTRAFVHYSSDGAWGWLDQSPCKERIEVIPGEIGDRDSVQRAMEGVQVVFHLAALIAIPYSYQVPASFVQANVVGTLNVLQAARTLGVERVIHTSTSEVYGTAQYVPIDEAHPIQTQSPYAASKSAADKLAESFVHSYDLPVVTVRPFNTFGPRQSARAIVPTIITQCIAGGAVRLGNLSPTRDLNFVADTVEGFVLAAQSPSAVGEVFNIGSGCEISIGDLAKTIAGLLRVSLEIECDAQRVRRQGSEVERLVASNARAKELLGWSPRYSMDDGLRHTIEWIEAHASWYRPRAYAI